MFNPSIFNMAKEEVERFLLSLEMAPPHTLLIAKGKTSISHTPRRRI
jgi:hypothetical protein